jgi:hypothetical protein
MYDIEVMQQCTDVRGQKVVVGDIVAFTITEMSVGTLKIGEVSTIELHKGPHPWQQFVRVVVDVSNKTYKYNIDHPGRLVKLND